MDLNKTGHKHLLEFQELIYHILNGHNEEMSMEFELDMGTGINIQAAVLLKTAMELYAIHFPKDDSMKLVLNSKFNYYFKAFINLIFLKDTVFISFFTFSNCYQFKVFIIFY